MQQEEQRLFQFLNGLDEEYAPQRNQLLLQTPLPSMEASCASLQQEEAQRNMLNATNRSEESSNMSSKVVKQTSEKQYVAKGSSEQGCRACGRKNHTTEE
ncbi:Spindle pole body component SPC98 [Bienertia sinuspersici]